MTSRALKEKERDPLEVGTDDGKLLPRKAAKRYIHSN